MGKVNVGRALTCLKAAEHLERKRADLSFRLFTINQQLNYWRDGAIAALEGRRHAAACPPDDPPESTGFEHCAWRFGFGGYPECDTCEHQLPGGKCETGGWRKGVTP